MGVAVERARERERVSERARECERARERARGPGHQQGRGRTTTTLHFFLGEREKILKL